MEPHIESIWKPGFPSFTKLPFQQDLAADVVIIGAGLAGILTGYMLKKQNIRVIILEADQPGSGQTGNTTAKITMQHGMIYHKLIHEWGYDRAKQYAEANEWALNDYERLIQELGCDCDYTHADAWLYTTSDPEPLLMEAQAERELGLPAEFTTETELPFPVTGAVRLQHQAHMHPLKLLHALSQDLEIYTHTPVLRVDGQVLQTPYGNIRGDHIVHAVHYPFINYPGMYFTRMHQERSYVIAYDGIKKPMQGMYLGVDPDGFSFRQYKDSLLIGSGSHRTGENPAGGQYQHISECAHHWWPEAKEITRWSAQDCMTLDGIPHIGRYAGSNRNWYVATGFGKWGMTTSMVAARMLTDAIAGRANPWEALYAPGRLRQYLYGRPLYNEISHSLRGLIKHHPEKPRCSHLGCQLEWNPDEQSWECPCHGSRFDAKGRLINGPAQTGVKLPEIPSDL